MPESDGTLDPSVLRAARTECHQVRSGKLLLILRCSTFFDCSMLVCRRETSTSGVWPTLASAKLLALPSQWLAKNRGKLLKLAAKIPG